MNYRKWLDEQCAEANRQFDAYRKLWDELYPVREDQREHYDLAYVGMNRWDARRCALEQACTEYVLSLREVA